MAALLTILRKRNAPVVLCGLLLGVSCGALAGVAPPWTSFRYQSASGAASLNETRWFTENDGAPAGSASLSVEDSGYAAKYCPEPTDFVCLRFPLSRFAVPKDLEQRIQRAIATDLTSVEWVFEDHQYKLSLGSKQFRSHPPSLVLLGSQRRAWHIIGHSLPTPNDRTPWEHPEHYYWSPTCGLLGFSMHHLVAHQGINEGRLRRVEEAFWAVDKRGFGATAACR